MIRRLSSILRVPEHNVVNRSDLSIESNDTHEPLVGFMTNRHNFQTRVFLSMTVQIRVRCDPWNGG